MTLTIKPISLPGRGSLCVRRQQIGNNLGDVVGKALSKKLRKLAAQRADKRVLVLERQHMNLVPEQILYEIGRQRADFPDLSSIDEIWILETIGYEQSGYFRFELYRDDKLVSDFGFQAGVLTSGSEDGMWLLI